MVVAGAGNDGAQEGPKLVDPTDHGATEHQKLGIFVRSVAGVQQIALGGVAHRPVDVLARSVHSGEGFLVKETPETVFLRQVSEGRHQKMLMVRCYVGGLKEGSDLKLPGSHFVVAGLCRNAQFVECVLDLLHEDLNALRDGTKVMIVELLTFCRRLSKKRATGQEKVRALTGEGSIHKEVLLLGPATGVHLSDIVMPQCLQYTSRRLVHGSVGAQQGG